MAINVVTSCRIISEKLRGDVYSQTLLVAIYHHRRHRTICRQRYTQKQNSSSLHFVSPADVIVKNATKRLFAVFGALLILPPPALAEHYSWP